MVKRFCLPVNCMRSRTAAAWLDPSSRGERGSINNSIDSSNKNQPQQLRRVRVRCSEGKTRSVATALCAKATAHSQGTFMGRSPIGSRLCESIDTNLVTARWHLCNEVPAATVVVLNEDETVAVCVLCARQLIPTALLHHWHSSVVRGRLPLIRRQRFQECRCFLRS